MYRGSLSLSRAFPCSVCVLRIVYCVLRIKRYIRADELALLLKELGMGDEDDSMNDAIAEMEIEASDTDGECQSQ